MIDYIEAVVPLTIPRPINSGSNHHTGHPHKPDYTVDVPLQLRGPHGGSMMVKSIGDDRLSLSGCPGKYLHGHNLTGSNHLPSVMLDVLQQVTDDLDIEPGPTDLRAWVSGDYALSRVDVTKNVDLGNSVNVRKVIPAVMQHAQHPRLDWSAHNGESFYWGQHSAHYGIKIYAKGQEFRDNPPGDDFDPDLLKQMTEWSDGKLRIELTMRKPLLVRRNLRHGGDWPTEETAVHELRTALENIAVNENVALLDSTVYDLPAKLRMVYHSWKAGENVRDMVNQKTFLTYRKQLAERGIDISIPYPRVLSADHTPIKTILLAADVPAPDWRRQRAA